MKQETSNVWQTIIKIFMVFLSVFMTVMTLHNYGRGQFWPLLIATAIALIVTIFVFICLK